MTRTPADDPRVQDLARELRDEAGTGRVEDYVERARELVSIRDNPDAGRQPPQAAVPSSAEPIEAVENQGEFPTLTDQGEEQTAPQRRRG